MQSQNHKTDYKLMPDTWNAVRIDSFLNINMGQSPPSESYNDQEVGLPFFQGVSDFQEIHPKPRIWCSDPKKIAYVGQILLSVRAPVGEVNLTNFKCCIGRGIAALQPINSDVGYCFYLLKQFKNKFLAYSQGTTFEAINRGDIATIKVPFTKELSEQQKIASILSKVDELIQKTDQIIEQTQRLKKGLMQRLLTKGIGHTKFKKTSMGEIPEEWIETPLGSIITLQRGHDLSIDNRNSGNIPVIGANGISGYHDASKASGPGVLIGRSGTLGKVYFIETDYWPLNTSLYVKQFHKGDPKFIYYLMHTIDYKKYNAGTTVPTLNRNLLHPLSVAIPKNIEEQQKIASILTRVEKLTEKEIVKKQIISSFKKGLMQKLLTGKIRVKV